MFTPSFVRSAHEKNSGPHCSAFAAAGQHDEVLAVNKYCCFVAGEWKAQLHSIKMNQTVICQFFKGPVIDRWCLTCWLTWKCTVLGIGPCWCHKGCQYLPLISLCSGHTHCTGKLRCILATFHSVSYQEDITQYFFLYLQQAIEEWLHLCSVQDFFILCPVNCNLGQCLTF